MFNLPTPKSDDQQSRTKWFSLFLWIGFSLFLVFGGCEDSTVKSLHSGDTGGTADTVNQEQDTTPEQTGPKVIEIESPESGSVTRGSRVEVTGLATNLDRIMLNEAEVEVTNGKFEAFVPLEEGPNLIRAHATGAQGDEVEVFRDSIPPELILDSPPRGLFLTRANMEPWILSGRVTDSGSGIETLNWSGNEVMIQSDGSFYHEIPKDPGINVLNLTCADQAGNSFSLTRACLFGDWREPSEEVNDALSVRMNEDGFDVIEAFMLQMLEEQDLEQLIMENAGSSEDFEIHSISYSRIELDLSPTHGGLNANIKIYDLVLEVSFTVEVIIELDLTGEVMANPAEMDAFISVSASPEGSVDMAIQNVEASMHDFSFDIENFPGFLEDWLEGTVRGFMEGALEGALNEMVFEELFDPETLVQELDLLGTTLTLQIILKELTFDPEGMTIMANVISTVPTRDPDIPPAPGYYATPNQPPTGTNIPKMVRLSPADDLLNNLLHTLWEGGVISLTIDEELLGGSDGESSLPISLDIGTFSLLVDTRLLEHFSGDTPVELRLRPLLPPVARMIPEGVDGAQEILIGDMLIDFYAVPVDTEGTLFASVAVNLWLDITMEVSETGELQPVLQTRAIADLDAEPLFDLDDKKIEQFLEGIMALIPDFAGDALAGIAPTEVQGIGLENMMFMADGAALDYLSILGDLVIQQPQE